MTVVDRSEVNQMAKFMTALGNNPDALTEMAYVPHESNSIAPPPPMVGTQDVSEMKAILQKFYEASTNVIKEAPIDKSLREALVMKKTKRGALIGNWEIVVNENGKRKYYDVIHKETSECIASELSLYEAACGLARALNEGMYINSKDVVELLRNELDYSNAVSEMIIYRRYLQKNPNGNKAGLYETRYTEAKHKAINSKSKISALSESF